jgi:hypothetical protein
VVKRNHIFENPLGSAKGIFYLRTLLFVFLFLVSSEHFAQAKMEIPETKKNFGFVKRGEIIRNEYEIINTGNAPLIISDIEISCSCTTAEFSKEPILPGKKSKVVVIFNTTTVYGRQDRIVYVNSNDPKGPYKLRYKGTVSSK